MHRRMLVEPSPTPTSGALHAQQRVGWQPSRFPFERVEAERAFQLTERLGSVNAAAQQLGTTWPSLRKAFTRHGLGMPARNPEAVRQRALAAARQRMVSRPRPWTGVRGAQPRRPPRPGNSHRPSCMSGSAARSSTPSWAPRWWSSCTAKSHAPQPTTPRLGPSYGGPTAATGWPANASARPPPGQLSRLHQPLPATQEREMMADARSPSWRDKPDDGPRFCACCLALVSLVHG
jgi:hypothetical protein